MAEGIAALKQEDGRAMEKGVTTEFEALSPVSGAWVAGRAYPSREGLSVYFQDVTERKQAQEALGRVREAERKRIARDLHDGPLQDFSYTAAAIGMIMLQSEDTELEERLQGAIDAVRRGALGLREVVHDLRFEDGEDRPFTDVVESVVRRNRILAAAEEAGGGRGGPSGASGRDGDAGLSRDPGGAHQCPQALGGEEDLGERSDGGGRSAGRGHRRRGGLRAGCLVGRGVRQHAREGGACRQRAGDRERSGTRHQRAVEGPLAAGKPGMTLEAQARRTRVMIVEDHADFRDLMKVLLDRQPDIELLAQAGSLVEARVMAARFELDVAILDLGLPDGSGADLISDLRRASRDVRVMVLSASLDPEGIEKARRAGADEILDKLTPLNEVLATLRRLGNA